jgi:Fe-S-cluster containining protein
MTCDRCGACCSYLVLPAVSLEVLPPDIRRWLEMHGTAHAHGLAIDAPCRHLVRTADGMATCAIYQERPELCRTWPAGSSGCRTSRARRAR